MNRPIVLGVAAMLLFALGVIAANTHSARGVIFPVTAYEADVNKDTRVNIADLGLVVSKFGQTAPTATPTTTPTATATDTPSVTSTPTRIAGMADVEVKVLGPTEIRVGEVATYLGVARNVGDVSARAQLSFVMAGVPEWVVLCNAAGYSIPTQSVIGCFLGGGTGGFSNDTLQPGESLFWVTTGYFNASLSETVEVRGVGATDPASLDGNSSNNAVFLTVNVLVP